MGQRAGAESSRTRPRSNREKRSEAWMTQEQIYECDVLVIGSGASGLSAAGAAAGHVWKGVVSEKEPRFGGTTARSGGWLWIPGTSLAKAWGIHETPEQARA